MTMSISERLTYSTVLISCKYKGNLVGSGTGFVMELQNGSGKYFIITNKHVIKDSIISSFELCLQDSEGNPIDTQAEAIDSAGKSWIMHPDPDIDLCCLPLSPLLESNPLYKNVFFLPLNAKLIPEKSILEELTALENIVMIGYPQGLSDLYNHKPIIRQGTTATHVKKDHQGKKEFLIDMACFPGSSGSPVFLLNQGFHYSGNALLPGDRILFLGVLYGGPQYTNEGELKFVNLPNIPIPTMRLPFNLGIAISASEILAFNEIL